MAVHVKDTDLSRQAGCDSDRCGKFGKRISHAE
jgi:hypothetical protein